MDGRRRAVRAATVVTVVVVVWVLPDLVNAILSCKDGFASRNNSTSVSPECYRKQWWRAVEQNKVPGMCLSNLQMSTPCQNNVTCEGLRSRREVMHPKEHIRDKKILCSEIPAVPANMVLARSADGFLGTCREGYGFSSPFIQSLGIRCQAGVWVKNHTHPCRPQCSNQCHNGGTCIDVETCLCPPGTAGPKCGTLVWGTCRTDVKWQNVIVKAIVQGLLLQCPRGYKLLQYKPYEHWLLQCKARRFEEPPGVTWDQENPCRPVCEPPCHEGATCVAPGKCDCGDGIACADCETRQLCALPVVRHGAAYRLAPQLSRVSCFGERLPAARSRNLLLRCSKDHWVTAGGKTVAANQVNCSFSCDRECQNGGRCVGLNRCQCRDGFVGSFCGHPVCGSTPLRVPHALYSMTSSAGVVSGTVRCNDQYRLASGEQQTSFQCRGGTWYFSGDMSGHKLVECHPLCSPPCVNRGTCLAPGHCLCSGGFTGKYCELRPTSTTDGMRCVFPFSNGHKIYSSCVIADDKIPWCPTQVNLDRKPLAWQMCNTTHNLEKVVGTISGRSCAFPFKWNGTTWWKCAHDDKDRYWCATHVTTNGHILQTDFCWLDHGLPHTQPECHSSMGCPLPSIPGASVVEIPFAAYPGLATNTATSTTTTTTKPITTIANEMPTLVIPQIPGMPPLPPLPPLFPLLPDLVPPPPPPTPPRMLPQPPPLPPMPFVPPPPPPMPPPLLLLQQPMPPQMPQPIPVFMPPSFQPQPVMQLAPIVPLQQLQPSPPQWETLTATLLEAPRRLN
ncbi:protein eyes shut homolog [Scylla paramamosain]|uniref:protein eyes shut homolog n=1 Tax=Scylla paramamosain TaxID=85552 RepID=UPI0030827E12